MGIGSADGDRTWVRGRACTDPTAGKLAGSFSAAMTPVYVLGISAYFHDSAAVLLRDGVIIAAVQEERFTRRKGEARLPVAAVEYCLEHAGIDICDVGHVAFYENPLEKLDRVLKTHAAVVPAGWDVARHSFPAWARRRIDVPNDIRTRPATWAPLPTQITTRAMRPAPSSRLRTTPPPSS